MKGIIFGVIGIYILITIASVIIIILSYIVWDKRFKSNKTIHIPPGFEKTDEVFIDPTTNRRISVYYNPNTAERFYKDEN